jgi:hypothetical protein
MKLYLYINIEEIEVLHRVINNPMQDFNKISLFLEKNNKGMILVSLDYDTYINLIDQNKIEVL